MAVIIEKTNGQKERWFYLDEFAKRSTFNVNYKKRCKNWRYRNNRL